MLICNLRSAMAAEPRSLGVLHLIVFPNYTLAQALFWFLKVHFVRACAYVLVLSESWQKYVYGYACTHAHTHTHRLGWAYYRTSDLQLLSPGIGTRLCVFILFAAGRTDDSSCASLPTRAALLPSNTDQIAVARRRVKCTFKPFISVLLFFFAVFDQCIILLVNTRSSLLWLFNLSTYSVCGCVYV